MLDKNLTYVVIGASNTPEKYGHKVFRDLLENGYHVIPINPNEEIILGEKVYPTMTSYKKKIDGVIFVVPPKVTNSLLPEIKKMKIDRIRMQPGSEDDEAISFCEKNNLECIHHACIMVQNGIWKNE